MKIVKELNGCKIEERANDRTGNKYYVLWFGNNWNIAPTLEEAISLYYVITR